MDPSMVDSAAHMISEHGWMVYLSLFIAPFVQEDAAVLGTASLAASGMAGPAPAVIAAGLSGLIASDLWKFWIGAAAREQAWAQRLTNGPKVQAAAEAVRKRLGQAIFTARFIPGTRIALYIAAGYFRAPFGRFAVFIAASAAVLVAAVYLLFLVLGEAIGDRAIFVVSAMMLAALFGALAIKLIAGRFSRQAESAHRES